MKKWIAVLLVLLTLVLCAAPALASEEAEPAPAEDAEAAPTEAAAPTAEVTPEEPAPETAEPDLVPAEAEEPEGSEDAEAVESEPEPAIPEDTAEESIEAGEEPTVESEEPAADAEEPYAEPPEAAADAVEPIVETMVWDWSDVFSATNDEMFAAFVDRELHEPSGGGMLRAANRSLFGKLGKYEKFVYSAVAPRLSAIADGTASPTADGFFSTKLAVDLSELYYTAAELGVASVTDENGEITQEAMEALRNRLGSFDRSMFGSVLRNDMPCDLYWYDKVVGTVISVSAADFRLNDTGDAISQNRTMTFRFTVADEYAMRGEDGKPILTTINFSDGTSLQYCFAMDPAIPEAVTTAKTTAQSIVTACAGKTDIGKLVAYRDAIRDLTDYNYAAAEDDSTPYGNPWQLIWVFDGDPGTKVVCEGYSKAFQYLCDLSSFSSDVQCYSVQGYLGSGAHMWNIVTMPDGWNYLVDVTNDDEYSLFLRGYASCTSTQLSDGTPTTQYTYVRSGGSRMYYTYGKNPATYYGDELLAMSPTAYGAVAGDVNGDHNLDSNDLLCLLKHVNGWDTDSYRPAFADVNGDNAVNLADLLRLLKKIVLQQSVELFFDGCADLR